MPLCQRSSANFMFMTTTGCCVICSYYQIYAALVANSRMQAFQRSRKWIYFSIALETGKFMMCLATLDAKLVVTWVNGVIVSGWIVRFAKHLLAMKLCFSENFSSPFGSKSVFHELKVRTWTSFSFQFQSVAQDGFMAGRRELQKQS